MGFIKNLKSLFIEESSTAEQVEPQEQPIEPESDGPSDESIAPPVKVASTSSGKVDQRFLETLLNALEHNNLDGFDYLEFRQALRNLSKMNMDEATQYKSAYALAQTMNVTPQDLSRTAQVYLDVLNKEQKTFSDALHNQEKTQINSRKERLAQLDKSIIQHQEQIESLMSSINAQRQEVDKLTSELAEVHQKIVDTQDRFTRTHAFLMEEIQSDVKKMDQYLK